MENNQARIVLADGTVFEGIAFGASGGAIGEAVFTTAMTGYQEVLSDPSYCDQIVTMTAPQIGNTGINREDQETNKPALSALVVRELSPLVSNWRSEQTLDAHLREHGVVGINKIDTRALTRHIRDHGAQMAAIGTQDAATLHDQAKAAAPMTGRNLTTKVSTTEVREWTESNGVWNTDTQAEANARHIVAIDYGVKYGILRCLVDSGCRVTVVPAQTSAADIVALEPDGIFLSNGPGDPAAVTSGINVVSELLGKRPIFGICLGHQILTKALGASTYKLKFGHRGLNQPVKDLATGRIEITSQNHGFCTDLRSLEGRCNLTHQHLNDDTCEGIEHAESGAFSVQYHPEAQAGPHDARYLFERFADRVDRYRDTGRVGK